jgi:hypothetical protein
LNLVQIFFKLLKGAIIMNKKERKSIFINVIFICLISFAFLKPVAGQETEEKTTKEDNTLIYGELYFLQTVSTGEDHFNTWDSIGFEAYKKFTGETGDWGEGDIQFRMTYSPLKNMIVTPMSANFSSIGQPIFHNAYITLRGNQGRNNIRFGHFDVPFGYEPDVDTHATLFQTLHMNNFGYVKDWGISMGGQLDTVDYEVGVFTGTGENLMFNRGSYLVSGRITNPTINDFRWGVSVAGGKTMREDGEVLDLWRVGFDTQYVYSQWTFKGEIYGGRTNGHPSYGVLGEADYTFPGQNLELEFQLQSSSNNTGFSGADTTAAIAGLTYRLSDSWSFRTAYSHYFNLPAVNGPSDQVGIQFYFYGKSTEKENNNAQTDIKYKLPVSLELTEPDLLKKNELPEHIK